MDSLAARVGTGEIDHNSPTHNPPSKLKTYGFAIAIIFGFGGLAVGITGLCGYFHVGALSNLAQLDAIIMMAVGGSGIAVGGIVGAVVFIIGRVGAVKNHQENSGQPHDDVQVNSEHGNTTQKPETTTKIGNTGSLASQDGLVYGSEAWPKLGEKWGCKLEILDAKIPEAPKESLAEGKIRVYIPKRVKVNGQEKDFTLNTLIEIGGGPFEYCSQVMDQCGNSTASGWIEIDKDVMPDSRSKNYDTQKKMAKEKGCRMPKALEAVVLNLMVFAFTGTRLYGVEPLTLTRCFEKVDGKYPVVVGFFGTSGLYVERDYFGLVIDPYGVAAVRKL
jgi:hypothetical protein